MTFDVDQLRARHAHCAPAICDMHQACDEIERWRDIADRLGRAIGNIADANAGEAKPAWAWATARSAVAAWNAAEGRT